MSQFYSRFFITKRTEYFYSTHILYSFSDIKALLAVYSRSKNNFTMRPLNWKLLKSTLFDFLRFGVTYH